MNVGLAFKRGRKKKNDADILATKVIENIYDELD